MSANTLKKIEPLNRLLESRFGIRVEIGPAEHMQSVLAHYEDKRRLLRQTLGEAQAYNNQDYAKAFLICEALKVLLREIAPKRNRKRKS
jgi:predicted transcriptional regulator